MDERTNGRASAPAKVDERVLWEKCAAFHGHVCGGLTIGFKAALYAIELLALTFSEDEKVVCIAENDACGVDAIQAALGCSIGKGNLLFHMRGKQAFSFYNRRTGQAVRLVLRDRPEGMTREQSLAYYQALSPAEMFDVKPATIRLPERAQLFQSRRCSRCGEVTGENWLRLRGGEAFCLDCLSRYDRFDV